MNKFAAISMSLATLATLSACGSGNSQEGVSAVSPSSSASSTSSPGAAGQSATVGTLTADKPASTGETVKAVVPFIWEAATVSPYQGFLATLNLEGSRGLLYHSNVPYFSLFVGDASQPATRFEYEVGDAVSDPAALELQANSMATLGFRLIDQYAAGSSNWRQVNAASTYYFLYRKDVGATATYSYHVLPLEYDPVAFLQAANSQGSIGYLTGISAGSPWRIFEKDQAGNSTFAYQLERRPVDADFLDVINAKGAQGYRLVEQDEFWPLEDRMLYAKDLSSSAKFVAAARPQPMTPNPVDFLNQLGAARSGFALATSLFTNGWVMTDLFITAVDCSGPLCSPTRVSSALRSPPPYSLSPGLTAPAPATVPWPPATPRQPSTNHSYAYSSEQFSGMTTLAAYETMGAQGYVPFGKYSMLSLAQMFVKEASTTYSYRMGDLYKSLDEMQAEANTLGGQGFQLLNVTYGFQSPTGDFLLYQRDDTLASTFAYRVFEPAATLDSFVQMLTLQGEQGYRPQFIDGLSPSIDYDWALDQKPMIFTKESGTTATFSFDLIDTLPSASSVQATVNDHGARGFRLIGSIGTLASGQQKLLFIRDNSQAASFTYSWRDDGNSIAVINQEATAGTAYVGSHLLPGGTGYYWFMTPSNCAGRFCSPSPLIDFVFSAPAQ